MIIVALASLFWVFSSTMFSSITQTGTSSISHLTDVMSSCMKIDSIYQNKIYLRNCGQGVITNDTINVYLDDIPYYFKMAPSIINRGELATIELFFFGVSYGDHSIKITNPSTEIIKIIEVYSSPDSKIVVDLRFDEGLGTTTKDFSEHENYGTLENGPSWIDGKYGKALKFDGTDDYVGILDSQSIRIRYAIQVEAWIKTSYTSPYNMSIANRFDGDVGSEKGWLLFLTNQGKLRFHVGDDSSNWAEATGTSNLIDGNWHHVIGTYNKSIIQAFVDGNLEGYTPFSNDIWNGTAGVQYGLNIGRRCSICGGSFGSLFNGTIDEVKIYEETMQPFKTPYIKMK